MQWKTPDDGQKNCRKNLELYSKTKFENLVHLVGFIIRIAFICLFIIFIYVEFQAFAAKISRYLAENNKNLG